MIKLANIEQNQGEMAGNRFSLVKFFQRFVKSEPYPCPLSQVMTESEAKTSTSKFFLVHSGSREPSPAKSDCDSERSGKGQGS